MKHLNELHHKSWKINLALFLCSFGIYTIYFHHIFLNINSILSSITLDSLKNYYTFVYHIKNDAKALHFAGMNFPYGEHVTYTDCQPIFTYVLRLLPFTHAYLIGIMHTLMFLSFIITPLILNKLLRLFDVDTFSSFFISLGIAFLSPQFLKINGGHFALAYGCAIPLSILLIVRFLREKTTKQILLLFAYNTFWFFLHPYLGFCLALFGFLASLFFDLWPFQLKRFLKNTFWAAITGLLPLVLFKVFMSLTDHHPNRTVEPFGAEMMVENLDSILSPVFGPFKPLMEYFFSNRSMHFEGHSYLGFFTILLFLFFVLLLPFSLKKLHPRKEISVIFLASFLFLLIAFGVHLKILDHFHIKSASLNQFRAVCRFAWIFYFTLPLFLIITLYNSFKDHVSSGIFKRIVMTVSLLFFFTNLVEAHYFFRLDHPAYWKFRNFFREGLLNAEEQKNLASLRTKLPQAILPLPVFHGGSEMYDRLGSNNSMIPSMIYSYHSGIPIYSALLSRTSISETEDMLQLLNSYKQEKPVVNLLNKKDLFVITTTDPLMPDEQRLLRYIKNFNRNDSLSFGYLSVKELLKRKTDDEIISLQSDQIKQADSSNVIYISTENRKPFLKANIMDYEKIFVLDSNKIKAGSYIVSFHYHYTMKTYRSLACDLIINRIGKTSSEWQYMIPVRLLSGFYPGFGMFEYKIDLSPEHSYEFMLKGYIDQSYQVSDFMLRPRHKTVLVINYARDTLFNNFPK